MRNNYSYSNDGYLVYGNNILMKYFYENNIPLTYYKTLTEYLMYRHWELVYWQKAFKLYENVTLKEVLHYELGNKYPQRLLYLIGKYKKDYPKITYRQKKRSNIIKDIYTGLDY